MARRILFIAVIAIGLGVIGMYVYDVAVCEAPYYEELLSTLTIVLSCVVIAIKLIRADRTSSHRRQPLVFYERAYADLLGDALLLSSHSRKKLLRAARYYDTDRPDAAVKLLLPLRSDCKTNADRLAVNVLIALSFTELGLADEAIQTYQGLIYSGITSGRVYSNLGCLYLSLGKNKDAEAMFRLAVQNDPENENAYHNLGSLYFKNAEFDRAIEYEKKSLDLNSKFRSAACTLAVIYALRGDEELRTRYFHIALSNGEDPNRLNAVIEHYLSELGDESMSATDY